MHSNKKRAPNVIDLFEGVPDEVLLEILRFLSLPDRLFLTCISRRFKTLITKNGSVWKREMKKILCFKNRMDFVAIALFSKVATLYIKTFYKDLNNFLNSKTTGLQIPLFEIEQSGSGQVFPHFVSLKEILDKKKCPIMLETTEEKVFKKKREQYLKTLEIKKKGDAFNDALQEICVVLCRVLTKYSFSTMINLNRESVEQLKTLLFDFKTVSKNTFYSNSNLNTEEWQKFEESLQFFLKRHPHIFFSSDIDLHNKLFQKTIEIIKNRDLPVTRLTLNLDGIRDSSTATQLFTGFSHHNIKLTSFSLLCNCRNSYRPNFFYDYAENLDLEVAKFLEKNKESLEKLELKICFETVGQYKNLFAGIKECKKLRDVSLTLNLVKFYKNPIYNKIKIPDFLVYEELWRLLDNLKLNRLKINFSDRSYEISAVSSLNFIHYTCHNKKHFNFNVKNLCYVFNFYNKPEFEKYIIYYENFLKFLDKKNSIKKLIVCREYNLINLSVPGFITDPSKELLGKCFNFKPNNYVIANEFLKKKAQRLPCNNKDNFIGIKCNNYH